MTQKEPTLMDRFDPWWYSCVEMSSKSWEWESVERTFGISRGMVDFIARVSPCQRDCIGGSKEVSNYHDVNLGCHTKRSKKATTRGSGRIRYWHAKGGGVHETASRYALVGVGHLVQRVELNCSTRSCDRKSIRHCLINSQVLMRSIMLD